MSVRPLSMKYCLMYLANGSARTYVNGIKLVLPTDVRILSYTRTVFESQEVLPPEVLHHKY